MIGTQSIDILPKGAADDYESYLRNMREGIDQIIEQTEKMAETLNGKDENNYSVRIQEFLQALADSATNVAIAVNEATEFGLEQLRKKNEIVVSSLQEEYISQIDRQRQTLRDIKSYQGCTLGGGEAFTSDDEVVFFDSMSDVYDEWEGQLERFQKEAEELAEENVTNELSDVYYIISTKLNKIRDAIEYNMENVGSHMDRTHDSMVRRTDNINRTVESSFDKATNDVTMNLEEKAQLLKELDF